MIRRAQAGDLKNIQELFVDTIMSICSVDYTPEQIIAWTSSVHNTSRWLDKINQQYFLVYTDHQQILGFGSLENGTYIDMFYTHNLHQGRGIGKQLYQALETKALDVLPNQFPLILSAHVSLTALSFFSGRGFKVEQEHTVRIDGIELINYLMNKTLN